MEMRVIGIADKSLTYVGASMVLEKRVLLLLDAQLELRKINASFTSRLFNIRRVHSLRNKISRLKQCIADEVLSS